VNLHGIAGPIVASVNPKTPAVVMISSGYTTLPDGSRAPAYQQPVQTMAQVQPLTFRDIQQLDGLNLQGMRVGIYLDGKLDGLIRSTRKGGDLVAISDGVHAGTYLVALVLEQWPDWVKVAATLQGTP
jgi:hypothetical protein